MSDEKPVPPPPPPVPPITQSRSVADDILGNKYAIIALIVFYVAWPLILIIGCLTTAIVMMCQGNVPWAIGFGVGFILSLAIGAYWITGPGGNIH